MIATAGTSATVQDWPRRRLIYLSILAVILLPQAPARGELDDNEAALVRMVLDAMEANYNVIRTAELTVREEVRDAGVKQESVQRFEAPSGGTVEVIRRPVSNWLLHVKIDAEKVRIDRSQGGAAKKLVETFVFAGDECVQFVRGAQAAWIRRRGELPGMLPLDPRQFGVDDIRRDIPRIFEEDDIASAAIIRDDHGQSLVEIVTQSPKGSQAMYEFSEAASYLPTRRLTHWPDGSVLQVIDVSYQEVGDGQARFPRRLRQRFYSEGAAQTPDDPDWRQQLTREVAGEIAVNHSIPEDVFQFQMPAGVRVSDNLRRAVYQSAGPLPQTSRRPRFLWVTVIATCALLIAVLHKHLSIIRNKDL